MPCNCAFLLLYAALCFWLWGCFRVPMVLSVWSRRGILWGIHCKLPQWFLFFRRLLLLLQRWLLPLWHLLLLLQRWQVQQLHLLHHLSVLLCWHIQQPGRHWL